MLASSLMQAKSIYLPTKGWALLLQINNQDNLPCIGQSHLGSPSTDTVF